MANEFDPNSLGAWLQSNPAYAKFFTGAGANAPSPTPWMRDVSHPLMDQQSMDPNVFNKMMPNHPGLAGRIGGAMLGASAVPGIPGTAGAGIQGVASSVANAPYARLMQAYQMMQPGLQTAELQSKLGLERAQTEDVYAQTQERSYSNQYKLMTAQARAQGTVAARDAAAKIDEGFDRAPEDIDVVGTNGMEHISKGTPAYGTWHKEVVYDEDGVPDIKKTFVPTHTAERGAQMKQYWPSQGATGTLDHQLDLILGRSGKTMETATPAEKADAYEKMKTLSGLELFGARQNAPISTADAEKARLSDLKTSDTEFYNKHTMDDKEIRALKPSQIYAAKQAAKDPAPLSEFTAKYVAQLKAHNTKMGQLYSEYNKLPNSAKQGFDAYVKSQGYDVDTMTGSGPTSGTTKPTAYWDEKSNSYRDSSTHEVVK